MKKNDDLALLGDVLDAIRRVESYVRGVSKQTFLENLIDDAGCGHAPDRDRRRSLEWHFG